jgi:hypothetical protein
MNLSKIEVEIEHSLFWKQPTFSILKHKNVNRLSEYAGRQFNQLKVLFITASGYSGVVCLRSCQR